MKKLVLPLCGVFGYLIPVVLLHTPLNWIFWLGLAFIVIFGLAHAFTAEIAHLINMPREAEMRRIADETLREKYSLDEHKRRLALLFPQEEPYTPSEPLPRYDIVMVDDWQSSYTSDMPVNRNEKVIAPFLCDKTVD